MNATETSAPRIGWYSTPNQRGTIDLIWTCILTMSLCSWSIICVNVPGPHETGRQILWRKLCLTALGVLCPEMTFGFAFCQWLQARESVRDMASLSTEETSSVERKEAIPTADHVPEQLGSIERKGRPSKWNMNKAFFAEMGGIRIHTKDNFTFPLDAKQLLWLVQRKYIKLPNLDEKEIKDKNKSDGLLRAITLCQILWFLIVVIGRWIQKLTVTTLELTTVSFIFASLGTAFLWWRKPADVQTAIYIETEFAVSELLQAENQTFTENCWTPLDFVNRLEWSGSKVWSHYVQILKLMHISFGSDVHPIDRIDDTMQNKPLTLGQLATITGVFYGFFAVFFSAWNHNFASRAEKIMWRIAIVEMFYTLAIVFVFLGLDLVTFPKIFSGANLGPSPCLRSLSGVIKSTKIGSLFGSLDRWLEHVRNNSTHKDPRLRMSLSLVLTADIHGFLYCSARAYILIADIIELRSLPTDAYQTVDWQRFWPHIG